MRALTFGPELAWAPKLPLHEPLLWQKPSRKKPVLWKYLFLGFISKMLVYDPMHEGL